MQYLTMSNRIKELCQVHNVSISTMLSDCGLVKSFIYDIEKRSKSPSIDKVVAIADYFDVSLDYLIGREVSK